MNDKNYDAGDLVHVDPSAPDRAGSGGGFGANLALLYRAGQIDLPDLAVRYYDLSMTAHGAGSTVSAQAGAAGSPRALTGTVDLIHDLHHAFASTCTSLRDCGATLSSIAQLYAGVDQDAVDAFNTRIRNSNVDLGATVPTIVDPPRPGDPLPTVLPSTTPPPLDEWTPPDPEEVVHPDDAPEPEPSYTD